MAGKLVGERTCESECSIGPDKPLMKSTAESEGEMPGGGTGKTIMTLDYNAQNNRYIGTFIGSMMIHLWVYDGTLVQAGLSESFAGLWHFALVVLGSLIRHGHLLRFLFLSRFLLFPHEFLICYVNAEPMPNLY